MKESILFYRCENCGYAWDIKFYPCIGLEVIRHISCPACDKEFTFTFTITAQMEERKNVA